MSQFLGISAWVRWLGNDASGHEVPAALIAVNYSFGILSWQCSPKKL